jgi:release factor glutamine methyltransferase
MRPGCSSLQTPARATPLGPALDAASARLAAAGVEQPRREARLLAAHLLGLTANTLLDTAIPVDEAALAALVERRAGREPLAFITGRQGFWTLDLAVSAATLIPRADSEALIEAALAALPRRADVTRVLDLGTGTGCLLLAVLSEFPSAFGVGVDLSPHAARLARGNAQSCGLLDRAAFITGDWAASLAGRFDLILCNPPYIEQQALAGLMPEVAQHEPARALDGGRTGLAAYEALMPELPRLLRPGGVAVFELGQGQADAVATLAKAAGLAHVSLRADLAGVDRALVLRL